MAKRAYIDQGIKLLNAGPLFGTLREFRFMWIEGRVSGGKTSLAVGLAEHFAKKGYRVVANIPVVFAEDPDMIHLNDDGMAKLFCLLDEGGMWLENVDAKAFKAYLGKLDVYVVLASVETPPRAFHKFRCEPVLNWLQKTGIPLIQYEWTFERKGKKDEVGKFSWSNPRHTWGMYSRQAPGMGAAGLDKMMDRLVREFIAHHNDGKSIEEVGNPNAENESYFWISPEQRQRAAQDEYIEAMERAADRMATAAEGVKKGQRKRGVLSKIFR